MARGVPLRAFRFNHLPSLAHHSSIQQDALGVKTAAHSREKAVRRLTILLRIKTATHSREKVVRRILTHMLDLADQIS